MTRPRKIYSLALARSLNYFFCKYVLLDTLSTLDYNII